MSSPLNNLKIASPCNAEWDNMIGDDRVRFCGQCNLNVYNLSGMSRSEAERLIIEREGKLCVRFYTRADGTIITSDCPVGWAAYKSRVQKIVTAVASLIFTFITGLGIYNYFFKPSSFKGGRMIGEVSLPPKTVKQSQPPVSSEMMGEMVRPVMMGSPVPLPVKPECKPPKRRSLPVVGAHSKKF